MIRHPIAIVVLGGVFVASSVAHTGGGIESVSVPLRVVVRTDSAGVELLKRANRLQADKQYAEALTLFDQAARELPQLSDWISVFAAISASYQGDTLEVSHRLQSVDDSTLVSWAWRARVRAFANAKNMRRALQVATAATKAGSSSRKADAWYRVAELQRDLGNASAQRAALFNALAVAPESGGALDAALVLVERKDLSANERVRAARVLMRTGELTGGIREMKRALASGAVTDASQARFEVGRALFSLGRYKDAIKELKLVPRRHERRIEARFLLARAQYRSGKESDGRQTLQDVADAYPKSAAATRALFFLGDLAQDENKIAEARRYFEKTANSPVKTEESGLALMRLGAMAYAQGDFAKADGIFERYYTRYASHQATYWLAQTKLRRGDEFGARQLLRSIVNAAPLSYYGMRAAKLLGDGFDPAIEPGPSTPADAIAAVNRRLDRWALLREVGWNEAASIEVGRLRQRFKDDRPALYTYAEELQRRGAPHVAIETGRMLLNNGSGWNQRLLRIMYPMPYQDVIEREARAQKLDPYFVAALIRQESRFNRNATSPVGAVGLMQIMPNTRRVLARAGVDAPGSLTDAETNIRLGTRFLADLFKMYNRRHDLVLAAYNAGPSRADRWRGFPEFAADDLFVERIPFEETRDYVKVVELNAEIYRALYGTDRSVSAAESAQP